MLIAFDPYGGTMNHFDTAGIIKEVARCGYDAINLPMNPHFVDSQEEAHLQNLESLLEGAGLKTPSILVAPFTWTTPGKEDETQSRVEVAIGLAKRFHANLLTMWPNPPEGVERRDAVNALKENMRRAVPEADAAGLPIAFEFEKGCPVDNYREAVDFIRSTDERIRIVADTYHMWNDQADFYEAAIAMKGLIGEVHISGSDRGEPGSDADQCDYEAFVRGLKETDWDGTVMLQYRMDDPASIERACAFTRRLFGL